MSSRGNGDVGVKSYRGRQKLWWRSVLGGGNQPKGCLDPNKKERKGYEEVRKRHFLVKPIKGD